MTNQPIRYIVKSPLEPEALASYNTNLGQDLAKSYAMATARQFSAEVFAQYTADGELVSIHSFVKNTPSAV